MSKPVEHKRVTFTTVGPMASTVNGSIAATARSGNDLLTETKPSSSSLHNLSGETITQSKQKKAIRLSLELSPTSGKSNYPEINYARLMRLEEKKLKKIKQKTNGASKSIPFEDNDEDVARIAEELEKKYGSSYGRGRGRSKRDDHCDIGMGYDESDSFIDNTDAYDEVIPEEVETIEGGFYINCGALEFKQLHSEASKLKTDEIIKMPKKSRIRIVSSSSSSDDTSAVSDEDEKSNTHSHRSKEGEDKVKDDFPQDVEMASNITDENHPPPKKDQTVLIEKKSVQQNGSQIEKLKERGLITMLPDSPKPSHEVDGTVSDGSEKDPVAARQKSVKTTTVKDMLKAKRDSFLKMQVGGGEASKSVNGELRGATSKSSDEETGSSSEEEDSDSESGSNQSVPSSKTKEVSGKKVDERVHKEDSTDKLRSTDTNLPELESELSTHILSFKELVKAKNLVGKRFQFDQSLTDLFLRIDESLLCIDKSHRNMVFAHLEYHLTLPRYFFLRKAKQLRIKEEKQKMQRSLAKLRKAVIEIMPSVISNYEVEVRKFSESQLASNAAVPSVKMPKKRFPWNSNFRNLLYDVYQTRWISYPVLRTRSEHLEDFIYVYLKEKVVEIWPSGWMRYEDIAKEIEKKKQSSKKSKEKKSDKSSGNSNLQLNAAASSNTIAVDTSAAATTTSKPLLNSYAKQFEDFTMSSRSLANSDTDSVASSTASNGNTLKRKGPPDELAPKSKIKSAKINTNGKSTNPNGCDKPLFNNAETISETKGISRLYTETGTGDLLNNEPPKSAAKTSALAISNTTHCSEKNFKHSNPASSKQDVHVIDLENYNSASSILNKTKQIQTTSVAVERPFTAGSIIKRSSSSDSDGVEIVGVFEANTNMNIASKSRTKKSQVPSTAANINMQVNNNNNKVVGMPAGFDVYNKSIPSVDIEQLSKNSATTSKDPLQ